MENTRMCGNMKFIFSVDQDISQVSKANEWDILFNTRNKFHISKHPCILLFIIEYINCNLPHKHFEPETKCRCCKRWIFKSSFTQDNSQDICFDMFVLCSVFTVRHLYKLFFVGFETRWGGVWGRNSLVEYGFLHQFMHLSVYLWFANEAVQERVS